MPTKKQLDTIRKMEVKIARLRNLGYPKRKLNNLIKSFDLPLGAHIRLSKA